MHGSWALGRASEGLAAKKVEDVLKSSSGDLVANKAKKVKKVEMGAGGYLANVRSAGVKYYVGKVLEGG